MGDDREPVDEAIRRAVLRLHSLLEEQPMCDTCWPEGAYAELDENGVVWVGGLAMSQACYKHLGGDLEALLAESEQPPEHHGT